MIADEILAVIADPLDDGSRMNRIADQFRGERPTSELRDALLSESAEVVGHACWIIYELAFEKYNSVEIIELLTRLVSHTDVNVRFHALGALFPAFLEDHQLGVKVVKRALGDEHAGIRMYAEATARALGICSQ